MTQLHENFSNRWRRFHRIAVADAYIKAGHKVVIIDNLSSGSRKNINPRANFYKADIRNAAALQKILRTSGRIS